jgi:hypothetical protein
MYGENCMHSSGERDAGNGPEYEREAREGHTHLHPTPPSSLIVTSSSEPRLMGSVIPECIIFCVPRTQSSMYMNERVCALTGGKKCF